MNEEHINSLKSVKEDINNKFKSYRKFLRDKNKYKI